MKPCVILVLPCMEYEKNEYLETKRGLEENNISVKTASTREGQAVAHHPNTSVVEETKPTTAHIDLSVDTIDPLSYQGIFLIGGPGATSYLNVHAVHKLIEDTHNFDIYHGAIGKACRVLAETTVLDGHTATGWNDDNQLSSILAQAGCSYSSEPVVTSGKLTTAKSSYAYQFGTTIAQHVSWY